MARPNPDSDDNSATDFDIDRENCGRCGGTGQITKMVNGRSGMVSCPDCDNIPEYAVPDNIPDDPQARLDAIEDELETLAKTEQKYETAADAINAARSSLGVARETGIFDADNEAILGFLQEAINSTTRRPLEQVKRGVEYDRQQLRDEQQQLQTVLDAAESQLDSPDQNPDGG